jgi:Na+/melibiose symporter-like transporter
MQLSPDLTYILTIIADCYTPILLIIALIELVRRWLREDKFFAARLIYAVAMVYLWMFVDAYFEFWATFKLDYSTHSAIAFALVVGVGSGKSRACKCGLALSLAIYGWLMYVLNYHSWADMGSTLVVIGICLIPIIHTQFRPISRAERSTSNT